jgi:hypothetical protein
MEYYEKIIEDKLEELVKYGDESRSQIAERWLEGDTDDDFGNLSGSRTFNSYKARQALYEAGFPFDEDLMDLLEGAGYNDLSIFKRGAEAIDVIICELLAPSVAQDVLDEIEAEEK